MARKEICESFFCSRFFADQSDYGNSAEALAINQFRGRRGSGA